ncbi:MAG: ADP-forming succinate--CoA ligase subunit beta [Acidimicrobiales bacterium]
MDLFEYQGKRYLARYGVPVSDGDVADSVEEALSVAARVGYPVVVKAQVLTGGRGKAGGVKLAADASEVAQHGEAMLGMDIRGHVVHRLWVEHASDIAAENYVSITLDREARDYLAMVSLRGGVEIEEVAKDDPSAIATMHIDPATGLSPDAAARLVAEAGFDPELGDQARDMLLDLYRCFAEGDADLVEVNPLIMTPAGRLHALDAKVTLDDNAAFRHPEWQEVRDYTGLDARETLAASKGLQYVGLSGSVGIIANGAGLAMSTLDVVAQAGGEPANFLDIGGGASAEVMAGALEVIDSDPSVRAILVNIFGGITRGEEVAGGILAALERVELSSPLVVRLDGTNAEQGRAMLAGVDPERLISVETMVGAAGRAVAIARERSGGSPVGAGTGEGGRA